MKIKDALKKETSIVFHSTRTRDELADIILSKGFVAGRVGGAMLGKGFYANRHLYQAQKQNYGPYIAKVQVFGVSGFLFLDKDVYEEFFGPASDDFVREQLTAAGIDSKINPLSREFNNTATLATALVNNHEREIRKNFGGIVYTGGYDKESVVVYDPEKHLKVLAFSEDKGETWLPVKDAKEFFSGRDRFTNLQHSSEEVRSLQRAEDLISRYANQSDEKLASAISSQISRIEHSGKKELRKKAFIEVLEEKRPAVVNLINKL